MSNRKPIPGWPHRGRADHRAPRTGASRPATRLVEAALLTWKRPALQLQRLAQILGLATIVGAVQRSDALETLRAQWVRLRDWAQDQARAALSSQAAETVRSSHAYAVVRRNAELVANYSRRTAESIRMHQITQTLRARPLAQGVLVAGLLMGVSGTAVAAPELDSEPISAVAQDARLATVAEAAASTLAHAQAVGDAANAAELSTADLEAATAELNRVLSDTTTEQVATDGATTQAATATDTATLAATTAAVAQDAAQRLEDLQAKLAEAGTAEQAEGTADAVTTAGSPLGAVTDETTVGPLSTDTSATASIVDVLTTSAVGSDNGTTAELQAALRQVTGLTEKVSGATGISTATTAVVGQIPETTVPSDEAIAAAEHAAAESAAAAQAAAEQAAAEQAAAEQAAAEAAAAEAAAAAQAQRQAADEASFAAADQHRARAAAQGSLNFANGQVPDSALCSLSFAPGQALRCDAAAAIEMLNVDYRRTFGTNMSITDSYRSYDAQVRVKAAKPYLAATPGTSNHGWGIALDLGGGIQTFGSEQHRWMQANAVNQKWVHPGWAQAGGSKPEAWHWEFAG